MSDDSLVTIEVDGQTLQAEPGTMLIEVTDRAGIRIPRFCYHKKLSVAANCRMCLVEVEKVPKPLPACATPVSNGMRVHTRSPMALAAQKGTMEFLLINHPLDCPICDQGGECELQDVAMGYGGDVSRYTENKRVVQDKNIGPLIATDMTRCIHCTRCVRFGMEIAGIQELGATGRGEHTRIGTYVERSVDSELSGNVIDLCPVGALTAKPSRFKARAWEMTQHESVAPHDAVGSNVYLHVRRGRVIRVVPKENESVNETWISDRDRFSYEGLYGEDRLTEPLMKIAGRWQAVGWETALEAAVQGLKNVISAHGAEHVGALAAPSCTLEELYLLQKLLRALGCDNVDHRLRQADFRAQDGAPLFPWLGQSLADLERLDVALLVGSNVRKEQPMLSHRLRKAALKNGASLIFLNPIRFDFNFPVADEIITTPQGMLEQLVGVCKALKQRPVKGFKKLFDGVKTTDAHREMADRLKDAENATVLLGGLALAHPDFSVLRSLAELVAEASGARFGYLTGGANGAGAWLAGAVPHRRAGGRASGGNGMDARSMIDLPRRAYLLLGLEPAYDFWDPASTQKALQQAETVVALTAFRSPSLEAAADVMLPVAAFGETSGTFVNVAGDWQSFQGAVPPVGEARPGWKVLRVLGNLLDCSGFEYLSSEEVRNELAASCEQRMPDSAYSGEKVGMPESSEGEWVRVSDVPIYAADALVRRATSLQHTADARVAEIRLNPADAQRLSLEGESQAAVVQNGSRAVLPLYLDERVSAGCVWIPAAVPGTETLGGQYAAITLEKV